MQAYQRDQRHRYRAKALAVLGDKCTICRIDDARVLQIDHVNGGGNREYRNGRNAQDVYRKIALGRADLREYQLLCANCNWIKRAENGEDGRRWS